MKFNERGDIVPIDIYIVWGAPASGKTTYVREHMEPGDLVVDLDLIKQSLSMQDKTETSDNLLNVAIGVRDYLYNVIETREIECNNVWVVAGLPQKEDREKLMQQLKTDKLIFIDTPIDECIKRAMNDTERKDKKKQQYIIDKWFKQYCYEG